MLKGNSKPFVAPELPQGTINLSDPDSRVTRSKGLPRRQAYKVQAAVTEGGSAEPAPFHRSSLFPHFALSALFDSLMATQ